VSITRYIYVALHFDMEYLRYIVTEETNFIFALLKSF
jgi:hypothetical protein